MKKLLYIIISILILASLACCAVSEKDTDKDIPKDHIIKIAEIIDISGFKKNYFVNDEFESQALITVTCHMI